MSSSPPLPLPLLLLPCVCAVFLCLICCTTFALVAVHTLRAEASEEVVVEQFVLPGGDWQRRVKIADESRIQARDVGSSCHG